ncbi:MAG: 1-acyl-sn-glycerol-3-phosphate acyltransferase [Coriobacteriia bacterium]|nr:1-acyl-sn-glycerol-3-phosphate acyltransferase [Coriobacteriia bacterium]
MIGNYERFDMGRKPTKPWRVLAPIIWSLSFPKFWRHHDKVDKTSLPAGLKPPYFLLCNHNSFMDFMIMSCATFPHQGNYVVAIDGFIGIEWLLRPVGGICARKFTLNITTVKNMLRGRDNGTIQVLFPEARYSLCGTTAVLPESLGKMVRKMNIPVVILIMHGHHINSPFWHVGNRGAKPLHAEMKLLFTQEEVKTLPVDELNARLKEAYFYDDFAWQKEHGIRVARKDRAEGLHKVLYQCPACHTEYEMSAHGHLLHCEHCDKTWEMTELGELRAQSGETEFTHIPDWYEWQRANVRREVEKGDYAFESEVRIESLPNSKGFVVFEEPGHLTHNAEGFTLSGICQGEPFTQSWPVLSLYSCHIEYDYKKRGDCIDLNTNNDTFYLFPQSDTPFSITKIALATEELHRFHDGKLAYWGDEQ